MHKHKHIAAMTPILLLLAVFVAPSLGSRLPHIIGGNDVEVAGTYPWQGSVQFLGSHSCGCSLVSEKWVITAGHCIMGVTFQSVILGVHDIKGRTEGSPKKYQIKQQFVHPDFELSGDGFPNDIGMMELKEAVTMNKFVGNVSLAPATATDEQYTDCVITGWGAIKMIGGIIPQMPDILQEAKVSIYMKETCKDMWKMIPGATILPGHICVGEQDLRGACSGDSGGPLTCQHGGRTVLAGLTSWGISNCSPSYPSVYTRVSEYRNWITNTTRGAL